jgi:uncharacterized DUF497 family protein
MAAISFEWDNNKNVRNKRVHGISFEEAQTSFYDEDARLIPDLYHSEQEERFLLLGYSFKGKLLTVCHCYRKDNEIIRIISARKASRSETDQYFQFKGQPL